MGGKEKGGGEEKGGGASIELRAHAVIVRFPLFHLITLEHIYFQLSLKQFRMAGFYSRQASSVGSHSFDGTQRLEEPVSKMTVKF